MPAMCDGLTTNRCCCANASCTQHTSALRSAFTRSEIKVKLDVYFYCFRSFPLYFWAFCNLRLCIHCLFEVFQLGAHLNLCAHGHCNFTTLYLRLCAFAGATTGALCSTCLSLTKSGNGLAFAPPIVSLDSLWITHLCNRSPTSYSI
jgi:hypothetical protein